MIISGEFINVWESYLSAVTRRLRFMRLIRDSPDLTTHLITVDMRGRRLQTGQSLDSWALYSRLDLLMAGETSATKLAVVEQYVNKRLMLTCLAYGRT